MTFKERRFFKKLNRCIYIGVFCIAAVIFWYNAGNKSVDNDNILDVAVADSNAVDSVNISADEKGLVGDDGSEESTQDETEDTTEEQTEDVNPLYEGMFIADVEGYLNIRQEASEDSEIVGKLSKNAGGEVLENGDGWTKIRSGSVEGYVKTEYIILGTQSTSEIEDALISVATVNTETLRVRAEESTESAVVDMVAKGDELTCVSVSDEWACVNIDDSTGYVSTDYVTISYKLKSAVSIAEELAAQEAAEAAAQAETGAATSQAEAATETTTAAAAETTTESTAKQTQSQTSTSTEKTTSSDQSVSTSVDDAYLLACLVQCEAGGESYEGKLAVANVVLNRLKAGWGSSISDIIYASGQFPPATNGTLDGVISSGPDSDCVNAANAALAGTNNVSGYYHFCASGAVDCESLGDYVIIGNHVFY